MEVDSREVRQVGRVTDPATVKQLWLLAKHGIRPKWEATRKEAEEMTRILVRYTVGFGLIEVLLEDPKIQDVALNSPYGSSPIYLVHEDYDECLTNIIPTEADAVSA